MATKVYDRLYNQSIDDTWLLSGPRWDNMAEIRIVSTNETRGYPVNRVVGTDEIRI